MSELDIVERLNDPEMYVDAVDDAIHEIERLREENAYLRERGCFSYHDAVRVQYQFCPFCGKDF